MKYIPNHALCRDFCCYEQNKLKGRSFFIPFSDRDTALSTPFQREIDESDRIISLDGEWDFAFYNDYNDLTELDTDTVEFKPISVPSVWQLNGYEAPQYINVRYPFSPNPPSIPEHFPLGVYRKKFELESKFYKHILSFLGVAGALAVFVNGNYVGYSEGSHNSAEFDITDKLVEGINEVVALVYKWSNGTYLEAQDMFRYNGIFRSVYLSKLCKNYIFDYKATTSKNADGTYALKVSVDCPELEFGSFSMQLLDGETVVAEGSVDKVQGGLNFPSLAVEEWSAEIPKLYTLLISANMDGQHVSYFKKSLGFRTVTIDGELFLVNGRKVKLLGANHHDTRPERGYAMTYDDMLLDITLMKSLNMNAVRTSHYPPHPYFIELCSRIGLYVVDEADIETHGMCFCLKHTGVFAQPINKLSQDIKWASHYVDRVLRMFERDKNSACVTMWSLGNESGGYRNHDLCYNRLKEVTDIPVHYEGVCRSKRGGYDVISHMYTDIPTMQRIGKKDLNRREKKRNTGKPYFLCEYAHAMGVGAGGLETYVETFLAYENLMGGCIWEWADHAAYKTHPKYELSYGGDNGETIHDGNFCCDGLVSPFRKPHPGALQAKYCYRPIRVKRVKDNTFEFTSILSFKDTSYIKTIYNVVKDGSVVNSGELELDIAPLSATVITLEELPSNGNSYIDFVFTDKEDGHEIAIQQIELSTEITQLSPKKNLVWKVEENDKTIVISSATSMVTFNKEINMVTGISDHGEQILRPITERYCEGIQANAWRAPTDNDAHLKNYWKSMGLYLPYVSNSTYQLIDDENGIKLSTNKVFRKKTIKMFNANVTYDFCKDGGINVTLRGTALSPSLNSIPKLGMILPLDKSFCNIEYFGRGNTENYPDMLNYAPLGIYKTTCDEIAEPHIYPQESGNRSDVRWAKITNESGHGLMVEGVSKFVNLNMTNYKLINITEVGHREDLVGTGTNFLYVDGFIHGIGSNSCGPRTESKYELSPKQQLEYTYKLTLI